MRIQTEYPWDVSEMVERMASSGIAGRRVIIIKDRSNSLHSYNTGWDEYSIHTYIHTPAPVEDSGI